MVKHARLKKLINWTVQGPIVTRLMVHFFSYNIATVFLLLVVYGVRGSLAAVTDQPLESTQMSFWQQASPVVICMFVMMPFMIWDLLKLTNRIAGPLFRFESLLKEYSKTGTLPLAVLRDGDLLTDYQRQFNDFVQALHTRYPETRPVNSPSGPDSATVAFRKSV
jgi:hypothetical protein